MEQKTRLSNSRYPVLMPVRGTGLSPIRGQLRRSSLRGFDWTNPMNRVFGIYSNTQLAEAAVDILVSAGIPSSAISVLYPDNESSRTFAGRKFTRPPADTASGETSHLPLAGLQGLSDSAAGPQAGALSAALAQMGVPAEWCAGRVLEGKILLSAETKNADQQACADGILRYSRAEDVATVTEPDNLVAKPSQEGPDIGTRNVAPVHGR